MTSLFLTLVLQTILLFSLALSSLYLDFRSQMARSRKEQLIIKCSCFVIAIISIYLVIDVIHTLFYVM